MGRLADAIGAVFLGMGACTTTRGTTIKWMPAAARGGARLLRLEAALEALKHAADNVPKMPAGAHHVVGSVLRTGRRAAGRLRATTKAPTDALTKATADLLTTGLDYVSLLLPASTRRAPTRRKCWGRCRSAPGRPRRARARARAPDGGRQDPRGRGRGAVPIVQVQLGSSATPPPGHVRPALAQTTRGWPPAGGEAAAARPHPLPPLVLLSASPWLVFAYCPP